MRWGAATGLRARHAGARELDPIRGGSRLRRREWTVSGRGHQGVRASCPRAVLLAPLQRCGRRQPRRGGAFGHGRTGPSERSSSRRWEAGRAKASKRRRDLNACKVTTRSTRSCPRSSRMRWRSAKRSSRLGIRVSSGRWRAGTTSQDAASATLRGRRDIARGVNRCPGSSAAGHLQRWR